MTSVTLERKQELLLQARNSRLSWINSSSSPYGYVYSEWDRQRCSNKTDHHDDIGNDRMEQLRSSLLGKVMKNSISIISMLYDPPLTSGDEDDTGNGDGDDNGNKGGKDLTVEDVADKFRLHGRERSKNNADREDCNAVTLIKTADDDALMQSYEETICKFRLPECSDIIYSMKNFIGSFNDTQKRLEKNSGNLDKEEKDGENDVGDDKDKVLTESDTDRSLQQKNIALLSSSIQKFLQTLYSTVYLHPLWSDQNDEGLSEDTKKSLEIFIYSKCRASIFEALDSKEDDAFLEDRLDFLHFVNPSHLDMHCLIEDEKEGAETKADDDNNNSGHTNDRKTKKIWRKRLEKPIATLKTLPVHNSPSQMLSCILQAYRQVNESLSSSDDANQDRFKDGNDGAKLAGADDLLPALILTTIAAKPIQIVSILKFIEGFASEDEMRGEAGYAYTNLYCAVQFLRDLDLDATSVEGEGGMGNEKKTENKSKKSSLSISPEDLRAAIEESAIRNTKLSDRKLKESTGVVVRPIPESSRVGPPCYVPIPIDEIRAARIRGEDIYAWARRRQAEERRVTAFSSDDALIGEDRARERWIEAERMFPYSQNRREPPRILPLPEGFTRNYNYVSITPDEVRMSDIPHLLKEYRSLVLGMETFLSDQTSRENEYRKEEVERSRRRLEMEAEEAEAAIRG